jgi:hypothetical protein
MTYAPGSSSCGTWLDARDKAKTNARDMRQLQFESFVFGFASAYNLYVSDAPSVGILSGTDFEGAFAYIDKACREDPTVAFTYTVNMLMDHLKSLQRTR